MNKQESPKVAIIGAGNVGKCMSHSLIESGAHLVQKNQCEVYKPQKEGSILILPNGYTKEEIEKLIIDHNISSDTKVGTLNAQGMLETINGETIELHRGLDIKPKEMVLPITNPYKDIDFPSSSKKPKVKKGYWHKGKLKYK